MRRRQVMCS